MQRLSVRQQDALELLYQEGAYIERGNLTFQDLYSFVRTPDKQTHNVFMNTFESLRARGLIEHDRSALKDYRYTKWVISKAGRELIEPLLCHCLEDDCTRAHGPAPA